VLIGITIGYLLSPIDLIPDFIPVFGLVDDLVIVPLLITASVKLIPVVVLADAREWIKNNTGKVKKNNWVVAIVIIAICVVLLYSLYRHFIPPKKN